MKILYLSIIVFFTLISVGFANAVTGPPFMTLQTDKDDYQNEDTLKISGLVADDLAQENPTMLIRVFSPDGSLYNSTIVTLEKVENPTQNLFTYGFEYSYNLKLNGAITGDYEIIASNYSEKYLTKWAVKLVTYQGGNLSPDDWHTFEMPTIGSNETHTIRYKVSDNARLEVMSYSSHQSQIYINVTIPPNGGDFIIQIPRTLVDSKYDNGTDRTFGVAMGTASIGPSDKFVEFGSNSTDRTLEIFLPPQLGFENIMIGGFNPIPEFPFAIPVLLIGITSMIVFYRTKIVK
ncbi:MAG: hypothetical protein ACREBB_04535 [Nitrosotalea sp.]